MKPVKKKILLELSITMCKIVFLVPYFGKFPDFFREWVYSAGYLANQNIDFLLITDIPIDFPLPDNIHILKTSFDELKTRIQNFFGFQPGLVIPYKLCDFRPAYGCIFEKELAAYDFWGNCDIDQVWGDVRRFITEDILRNYDRIQFLGHFTLYRNTPAINKAFTLRGAIYDYKRVFGDTMHYSFCEHSGIMKIVVQNKISNYLRINYADLSPRYSRMIISRQPNYDYQIIYWENGRVYRAYVDQNGEARQDEYMYFHFQRKHPASLSCWNENRIPERIIFHAEGFIEDKAEPITPAYIKKYADFISHEADANENKQYNRAKFKSFLSSPMKKKVLWIKQTIATQQVVKHEEYFGENYQNSNR